MTWLIWAKEILEFIGAGAVALTIAAKCFEFLYKLFRVVQELRLELNGRGERTLAEKVMHERDE